MIEKMVPNGEKLELYGTSYNLRNYWTTIGIGVNPIHEWRRISSGYLHGLIPPIFNSRNENQFR